MGYEQFESMNNSFSASSAVIVIGAGAAGLMAAGFSALQGRRTILLERTSDGGRKILISGGGRCNILPSRLSTSQFVTASSPTLLKKMLRAWPLAKQREFFEKELNLELALEEESGKLFPTSNRARDVRDGLVAWNRRAGVELRFDAHVVDLESQDNIWRVHLADGEVVEGSRVILATGGLSVPKTGSDGTGLSIATKLGHTINPTYPALTPLTADPPTHEELAGLSLNVRLETSGIAGALVTEGGFLFTHRGYSGPSVLDISHLPILSRMKGDTRQEVYARWVDRDEEGWRDELIKGGRWRVTAVLREVLPERLAEFLVVESGLPYDRVCSELRRDEREELIERLIRYRLPWTGDEGYKKAEVTGGGVALEEVNPKTLESKRHPGLYFCGEMLDAFGPIGGYNFLWAWGTGRSAGMSL